MFHFLYNSTPLTFNDSLEPWYLLFQDNTTPQMEGLERLHNNIMFYLAIILFAISWIILSIILNYNKAKISNKYTNHGTLVALIWSITSILIVLITIPSFKLLYLMDEVIDPSLVIYGEGHQWYWSYQYPDFTNKDEEFIEFDSYIVPESDLEIGKLRMLEVDNRVIIPELTHTVGVEWIFNNSQNSHTFVTILLQNSFCSTKLSNKKKTSQMYPSRNFSSSGRCSTTPLEQQREITRMSREVLWQAKDNLFSHQDSHSSICFDVAVREFSARRRELYMNRYQAWNNDSNRVSGIREAILNDQTRTSTNKALMETQADLCNLTLQKSFLRDAEVYMHRFSPHLTNTERVDRSVLFAERSELWTQYFQRFIDHMDELWILQAMENFSG